MRIMILLLTFFSPCLILGQKKAFPETWEGNWKGQLQWFQAGNDTARKVNMELRIHKTDSAGVWTWQIIYGSETEDNRPYKLMRRDAAGVHWVIDENSGIVLDQYWVANKFCGAFTVMSSTIFNSYWMENGKLVVEFYSVSAKPVATTGKGNEDVPFVDSYGVKSYQKAVLSRVK